jgi:DNA polymerase III epsilon subunit-like protein
MRHIIIHGHFTISKNKFEQQELIEICAIKIDENYNELSTFESYCKPTNMVNHQTYIVTNISFDNLEKAPDFINLIHNLKDWIGNEDVLLITWNNNFSKQMSKLCKLYMLEWNYSSLDIQMEISMQLNNNEKMPSLDYTLDLLGKQLIGVRRIAKLDCINILNVFSQYNKLNFDKPQKMDFRSSNSSKSQKRKVMLADLLKRIINTGSNYLLPKMELIDLVKTKAKNSIAYNNFIEKYGEAEKLESRMNNLLDSDWLDRKRTEAISSHVEENEQTK